MFVNRRIMVRIEKRVICVECVLMWRCNQDLWYVKDHLENVTTWEKARDLEERAFHKYESTMN